jgi:hypothetical protein
MMLVKVWTDIGARKPAQLLAKIIENDGVIFTIRYLSESDDKIWRYEEDDYEIDDKSVAEYLHTENEEDIGFIKYQDGFKKVDSDEDYEPSDESYTESDMTDLEEEGDETEPDASSTESDESEAEDE